MPPAKNPYEVLRVSPTAGQQDIDAAYQRLKGLLANDALASYGMMDPEQASALAQELDAAYALIGEAAVRTNFDQGQHPWAIEAALGHDVSSASHQHVSEEKSPTTVEQDVPKRPPMTEAPAPAPRVERPPVARLFVPDTELPEPSTPLDGALLQRLRVAAQASLDDISHLTKINRRYLTAIEHDDFAQLPGGVYVRGFVGEYLRVLGLNCRAGVDSQALLATFIDRYQTWRRERH